MTIRTKRIVLTALSLAVIGALAIPKILSMSEEPKEKPKGGGGGGRGGAVSVQAYIARPERLDDKIFVSGTVMPNENVELHSETSGKIVSINFKEGGYVSRGQLLVKINDADLQAQLKKAIYKKELLDSKELRQRQLLQKEAVSQSEYDVALNEVNTAVAEIELIRAQIAKTEIRAPFSGVIGLRYVSEGSFISPSTPVATFYSVDPVKVDFAIPEKYAASVRIGADISFTVEGSDNGFSGRVYAVEPKIDQTTRTLQVRALCSNGGGKIAPGAFAQIELLLHEIGDAIMVPSEAVSPELEGKKVVVSKEGKAEPRKIIAGIRTDKKVQVIEGLNPGDTVVTSGILQVRPGSALKITSVVDTTSN